MKMDDLMWLRRIDLIIVLSKSVFTLLISRSTLFELCGSKAEVGSSRRNKSGEEAKT